MLVRRHLQSKAIEEQLVSDGQPGLQYSVLSIVGGHAAGCPAMSSGRGRLLLLQRGFSRMPCGKNCNHLLFPGVLQVRRNIPFRVVGGVAFWKRKEIQVSRRCNTAGARLCHARCAIPPLFSSRVQGIIAYLRLAVGLRDELALRDTINMPKYNCVEGSVNTAIWNIALRKLCTDEQQVLLANRRRGIGEASLQKLQDYAASRGQTLSELLFGSPGAVEDGSGPEPLLLPGHKELGISANVLAKLNSFRQLMLELHASVKMRSLDLAMGDILKKVKKVGRPACRPMAGHCLSPLCLAAGGPCQQLAHVCASSHADWLQTARVVWGLRQGRCKGAHGASAESGGFAATSCAAGAHNPAAVRLIRRAPLNLFINR